MAWSLGSGEFPCHGWKTLMSLLRSSLLPWDTVIHHVDILLWSILKKQKFTNLYQLGALVTQEWIPSIRSGPTEIKTLTAA